MGRTKLSVVVPVFNEEKTLPSLLKTLLPVLKTVIGENWEVIISDDGSLDGTTEVPRRLGLDGRVRVLRSDRNRGKGSALRAGVRESRGERVLWCDADMATPEDMVRSFIKALDDGALIAVGNRKSPESRIILRQPPLRRVLGGVFNRLARCIICPAIADFNCGFKLFQGDVARELLSVSRVDRWAIDIEILGLAVRKGYRIVELPVVWRHGDNSSVRVPNAVWGTLWDMARVWRSLRRK